MPPTSASVSVAAPLRPPFLVALAGWLIPGAGHFLLGRRGRGAIVFATVLAAFVIGMLLRGPLFHFTAAGDLLSRLIQAGGFIGDMAAGLPYFLAVWLGYAPPDIAGHDPDYGSKFLVAAGLLNILGIVDAYEIATRQKD